jgi:hypothetical protein
MIEAVTTRAYRDTSVMMHSGIAAGDAATALAHGEIRRSFRLLFRRSAARSLRAAAEVAPQVARWARRKGLGPLGADAARKASMPGSTRRESRREH